MSKAARDARSGKNRFPSRRILPNITDTAPQPGDTMRDSLRRTWAPVAAATLLILTPSSGLWAGGGAGDAKAVDRALHSSLKDVINQGASLYNRGDRYGCYRVYDGALRAIRPLLGNHADLQKLIDEALAGVEQLPSPGHRAFALRDVLDAVRGKLGGGEQKTTLWDRLGGEDNVRKVVHEFVVTAGADPKVNITRGGKFKLDDKKVALLEQRVVEYVSSISGGPLRYTGKSMKEVHKGMAITNA